MQIPPEQMHMLSFIFLGIHLLHFLNKETVFLQCLLSRMNIPFFIQCTTWRERVGWTDSGHLAILYTHICEMTCTYVYAYTCVCVCIHIHRDFYLRLSQK